VEFFHTNNNIRVEFFSVAAVNFKKLKEEIRDKLLEHEIIKSFR